MNHHIWCNYFILPVEGCKMCERLNREYPMDNSTPDEMMAEYFPLAQVVNIKPAEGGEGR